MKFKILGFTAIAGLLALQSTTASADTDVYVGLQLGAPVVVERRPVYREYYYEPAPVYYTETHVYPRTRVHRSYYETRYYERHRHDNGLHRGHYKQHKHKHKHRHY